MNADDERHGTRRGYYAHRVDNETACDPCKRAAAAAEARYEYGRIKGVRHSHPPHHVSRRIRALVAIGWTQGQIAEKAGATRTLVQSWERGAMGDVQSATVDRVRAVYAELHMTPAPDSYGARRALTRASRRGYLPPLAWDNIDTDPEPRRGRVPSDRSVDHAAVLRVLNGDVVPTNTAERHEIVRRWKAAGKSERALCERMGWHDGRYGRAS